MVNRIILLICIFLLLGSLGCSTKYIEKPVEVAVPTIIEIYKPTRPVYSKQDTTTSYMIKVLEYCKMLEVSIDEHNNLLNK